MAIHLSGLPGEPSLSRGGRAAHFPRLTLLRVGFTEPPRSPSVLVRSYRTVSPLPVRTRRPAIGGFLSVALSCGSPRLAVSQHPALWSPDLSRHGPAERPVPRPPGRFTVNINSATARHAMVSPARVPYAPPTTQLRSRRSRGLPLEASEGQTRHRLRRQSQWMRITGLRRWVRNAEARWGRITPAKRRTNTWCQ